MEINKIKITFEDVMKLTFEKISSGSNNRINRLSRSKSLNILNEISEEQNHDLIKLNVFSKFESIALDIWSCVFWKAKKDLENDIEVLLKGLFRMWKTPSGELACTTLPSTGVTTWVQTSGELASK